MNCREAQALISKYVQDQLDVKTLEAFLQHVKNCPDCMEELEVYYIVFTGIKRLDEDENIAVNYHTEFEREIKKSELSVKRVKTRVHIKKGIYIALCLVAVLVCSIQLGKIETKKQLYKSSGESTYDLPYYFFDGKQDKLDQYVKPSAGVKPEKTGNTTKDRINMNDVRSNQ